MTQILVDENGAGQRVDAFLAAQMQVSRSRIQTWLKGGLAQVNDQVAKPSQILNCGDVLKVQVASEEAPPLTIPLLENLPPLPPVLFEDESLMILNKPRGLAVHPGAGERQATLVDVLRAAEKPLSTVGPAERAGIVHRLDKDTSGLIIVCKSDTAHWKLAEDFAARRLEKNYLALVCGVPPLRGRIEAPIERHATHRKKFAVAPHGKHAVTEYHVTKSWRKFALLDVRLLTGRTHQIRVHLNYINHPIVGDPLYGGEKRALDTAPSPQAKAALQNLHGQALHAARLSFTHPQSGATLFFEAPLPVEMAAVIENLGEPERYYKFD
jgi:23S rRNA pseudouridine1911/1915/1917 synthase